MGDHLDIPSESTAMRIPHPRGILRWVFRAPILLYRMRLGWLLGTRFLLIHHRGRRSGVTRQTVVEVVDSDVHHGSYVVVAAWGRKTDWYRNIVADPQVEIEVSTERVAAMARTVTRQEAELHLREFSRRHPTAFKELGSVLVGQRSQDPEETVRRFVQAMPVVEFTPRGAPASAGPA